MKVDAPPLEHQVISRAWADTKKGNGDFVSFRDALQTAIARMLWEQKAEITDLKEENERLKALLRDANNSLKWFDHATNHMGCAVVLPLIDRIDAALGSYTAKTETSSSEPSPASDEQRLPER